MKFCSSRKHVCTPEMLSALFGTNAFYNVSSLKPESFFSKESGPYVVFITNNESHYAIFFDTVVIFARKTKEEIQRRYEKYFETRVLFPKNPNVVNNVYEVREVDEAIGGKVVLKAVDDKTLQFASKYLNKDAEPSAQLVLSTSDVVLTNPTRIDLGWKYYKKTVKLMCRLRVELDVLIQVVLHSYTKQTLKICIASNEESDNYLHNPQIARIDIHILAAKRAKVQLKLRDHDSLSEDLISEHDPEVVDRFLYKDLIVLLKLLTMDPVKLTYVLKSMSSEQDVLLFTNTAKRDDVDFKFVATKKSANSDYSISYSWLHEQTTDSESDDSDSLDDMGFPRWAYSPRVIKFEYALPQVIN